MTPTPAFSAEVTAQVVTALRQCQDAHERGDHEAAQSAADRLADLHELVARSLPVQGTTPA